MKGWGLAFAPVCAAMMIFVLTSCSDVDKSLFEQYRPPTQADAGSVHLAVAPPIPFEAVRLAISPGYKLTGDDAVKAALPTTGYMEDRFLEMFTAALGLGLSRTSVTGTRSDGTAPAAKAPDVKLNDSGKSVLSTGDDKRPLKQDAMLQYSAATALYQEVHLLEQYVSYASRRHGYKPLVLRFNVGLQPFARNQPYDVYASIGFFAPLQGSPGCYPPTPGFVRQPYVLPLLVTDNLEGMATARSAEMITQLALAVSVLIQGIAGEASFGYTRDRLKSVLGTDLNALLTVSRSVDNVIQVRLGAVSQPTARFAMVPRNHTITALILVPKEHFDLCPERPPLLNVTMKTVYRDALNGHPLVFNSAILQDAVRPALRRAGVSETAMAILFENQHKLLGELMAAVQMQERTTFENVLNGIRQRGGLTGFPEAVWLVLAEIQSRSDYQTASVLLCDPEPAKIKSATACAVFKDLPVKPAPPEKADKDKTTATGATITTTITTTTNPPSKQ